MNRQSSDSFEGVPEDKSGLSDLEEFKNLLMNVGEEVETIHQRTLSDVETYLTFQNFIETAEIKAASLQETALTAEESKMQITKLIQETRKRAKMLTRELAKVQEIGFWGQLLIEEN